MGIHVSPHPDAPTRSFSILSLWVVPEHWVWVLCFMHQIALVISFTYDNVYVCFQGKPSNVTVIQAYAPTSNAEEAEVEWFYEALQDLLELTPKRNVLFIIGDWNAKVGSQETPGVTGKFGLGV